MVSGTKYGDNSLPTNPFDPVTGNGTDWNNQYEERAIDGITLIIEETTKTGTELETEDSTTDTAKYPLNLRDYILASDSDHGSINLSLRDSYKLGGPRTANTSKVRMELRCGKDASVFELVGVQIDYLKAPLHIRLTQEQVDLIDDTSQMMEWPDYVCQEIINELVHVLMEKDGDPRLQTHIPLTTSIAPPAQQLAAAASATAE